MGEDISDEDCIVKKFFMQDSFNLTQYMGPWYVLADTGLFPFQHTLDNMVPLVQDLKSFYELDDDGNVKIVTG